MAKKSMQVTSIKFNADEWTRQFRSPGGMVWLDIRKKGTAVKRKAKHLAPVDTSRLQRSITLKMELQKAAPTAIIGTNVEYAYWVHEGTRRMKARPFLTDALKAALENT